MSVAPDAVSTGAACGVRLLASADLPTRHGPFRMVAFVADGEGGPGCDPAGAVEHLALLHGDLASGVPLVRVHSECLTGDVLGSLRCDCGDQLDDALALVQRERCGAVVYLRGHEGRGIGLAAKVRAYDLQQRHGLDTLAANTALGLPVDARSYAAATGLLRAVGVRRLRLLTNNPDKVAAVRRAGLRCTEVVPMPATGTPHSQGYLRAKVARLGHAGLLAGGTVRQAGRQDVEREEPTWVS